MPVPVAVRRGNRYGVAGRMEGFVSGPGMERSQAGESGRRAAMLMEEGALLVG